MKILLNILGSYLGIYLFAGMFNELFEWFYIMIIFPKMIFLSMILLYSNGCLLSLILFCICFNKLKFELK